MTLITTNKNLSSNMIENINEKEKIKGYSSSLKENNFYCEIEEISKENTKNELKIIVKGKIYTELEIRQIFMIGFTGTESITSKLENNGRSFSFKAEVPTPDITSNVEEIIISLFTLDGRLISKEINLDILNNSKIEENKNTKEILEINFLTLKTDIKANQFLNNSIVNLNSVKKIEFNKPLLNNFQELNYLSKNQLPKNYLFVTCSKVFLDLINFIKLNPNILNKLNIILYVEDSNNFKNDLTKHYSEDINDLKKLSYFLDLIIANSLNDLGILNKISSSPVFVIEEEIKTHNINNYFSNEFKGLDEMK